MAPGTIHRIVINPVGPATEKCAPLIRKVFRTRRGWWCLMWLTNKLFNLGVFLLEFREFLFEQSRLVDRECQSLPKDGCGSALLDPAIKVVKQRTGHGASCEK